MNLSLSLSSRKRLDWIDWMKTIGIYLIVLGHFCSIGEKFIYVFHVPLFFVISGFLCKKECDEHLFWKKLWFNLGVPMLIMTAIYILYICILQLLDGTFEPKLIYWCVRKVLLGIVSGFGNLWFVYTLIILKIIFQYISSKTFLYSLVVVMLALAFVYNKTAPTAFPFFIKAPNAVVDVCTAYPFFMLGVFLQQYNKFNELDGKVKMFLLFVCGLLLVAISNHYNGYVAMFHCDYGGDMFWFLVGGVAGSMMVFALSKLVGHASMIIITISRGTIIILGLQMLFIDLTRCMFQASYYDILFAAIIVVMFVPIIKLVEKYFPLMVGIYRAKNSLTRGNS